MAEDKQEKSYEVKDKRRVNPDGSLKEEAEPAGKQPEEAKAEAAESEKAQASEEHAHEHAHGHEHAHEAEEEMPPPDVYQTLQFMAGMMAEQAWVFMGLHLPPGHKEPMQDMAQAKLAIDTVIFIGDKIHPHLDEEGRNALRRLVSDLQLNYVQRGQAQ